MNIDDPTRRGHVDIRAALSPAGLGLVLAAGGATDPHSHGRDPANCEGTLGGRRPDTRSIDASRVRPPCCKGWRETLSADAPLRAAGKLDPQVLAPRQPAVDDTITQDQRSQGVAERTEGVQTCRYSMSVEATQRELRLCGFALLNHYLTMHQVIAEHVRLQPVELLILIATTTGNVQRALRPKALPEAFRSSKSLPPELVVPMSRRAIARVTGLPTETVRRHVESMLRRGILVSTPKGVLAPNRLAEPWAAAATLRLIESHAACTEQLMALQVIAPQPPPAARSKRA